MTHWAKYKDPNFLSGEDLKYGNIEDMPDGVVAKISSFRESIGFDQSKQKKVPVVELRFEDLNGKALSKGVIPAKWTYTFMQKNGVSSPEVEDWIGQIVIIYAKQDKRFGHVVRFKPYIPRIIELVPNTKNWDVMVKWMCADEKRTIKQILTKYKFTGDNLKKFESECKSFKK